MTGPLDRRRPRPAPVVDAEPSGAWARIRDVVHTLFQGLTAVAAVAALVFTAQSLDYTADATNATRDQVRLAERGQVTDRFSRAIDQLGQAGDDKLSIRLGGIYALERLMRDSPPDQSTVIEVLCAFVRTNAPRPHQVPSEVPPAAPDVRAAIAVLARRPDPDPDPDKDENGRVTVRTFGVDDPDRLDLSGTLLGLRDAYMPNANLNGADLRGADLSYTRLEGANLRVANLDDADLRHANLIMADLRGADLRETHVTGEQLAGATIDGDTILPEERAQPAPQPTR